MECTQRLECTQNQNDICSERANPEEIGFLGICGSEHPVKKGPNKIGRDPETCNIVLKDNSISRQHAVINILNKRDFMLMDLDSFNKTMLMGKILQPYIPHPLKNGDTVQFGQVFGIFRLFEEDDDLPMTQAIEIPDTPVCNRNAVRLKTAPITTIPESPDVSDRDDSIIGQSPKKKLDHIISTNNNFMKPSRKFINTEEIRTNKINNVYWTSSRKSDSFSSHYESDSVKTMDRSSKSPKKLTLETSIYDMETQVPGRTDINETSNSIYEADTQVPKTDVPTTIYDCGTQVSNVGKLPEVYKVKNQSNVQLNLYSTNEKHGIFDAETQVTLQEKEKTTVPTIVNKENGAVPSITKNVNSSDEEICFDGIDCEQYENALGSQPLLPPDLDNLTINEGKQKQSNIEHTKPKNSAIMNDSDTKDSEELIPSQSVKEKAIDDEDVTDCEDNMIELAVSVVKHPNKIEDDETDCEDDLKTVNVNNNKLKTADDDLTDCEDDFIVITQNTTEKQIEPGNDNVPFEEMLTQVIDECPDENNVISHIENNVNLIPFEDLQTQVICHEIPQEQTSSATKRTENNNSFKRPLSSPKTRKKDVTLVKSPKHTRVTTKVNIDKERKDDDEHNYYAATQEIMNDLCTQIEQTSIPANKNATKGLYKKVNMVNMARFSGNNATDRGDSYFPNLSTERVSEANVCIATLTKKKSSDSSDLEVTPKKKNISKFLEIDLPNSPDIKSCDFITSKVDESDSIDEFEDEDDKEDSPRMHKRRRKKNVKLDLMKKFDINTLPTRAITRIRKPTSKILASDSITKKMSERILQSHLGLDKEHEFDREIVELNLRRHRSKMEKLQNKSGDSSRKFDKHEKDSLAKQLEKEQSMQSCDKKGSKKLMLPHKTEVQQQIKVLQQQNIKSMFKESNSKVDVRQNVETESIDSSIETRRSAGNKSKRDTKEATKLEESHLETSEKEKSSRRSNSSHLLKDINQQIKNKEPVVRRSRRHQSKKDLIEDKKEKSHKNRKSDKLQNNELSKVYDLSSEKAVDTSTSLKRRASDDTLASKTKKAKSSNSSNASGRTTSLRGIKTQYVLFTAFRCEEVKQKLEKLGAVIVTDVKKCTVVLTLQIKRTFKLLCAMGLGKPIVGPNWVQACADSNMIVDPWLYLMKDEATEKRFGFNLRQSLTSKRNFLKGHNVYCTPNVTPCAQEMKSIVECSGGTWKEGGKSWFCVSCSADKGLWPELRKRGAVLVSTEFILGGVLQQRMNLARDKLQ